MRTAAEEASVAELGRLAEETAALAAFGLVRYAAVFGVALPAGVTVAPSGLSDSVLERIKRLAGEHPRDDA